MAIRSSSPTSLKKERPDDLVAIGWDQADETVRDFVTSAFGARVFC